MQSDQPSILDFVIKFFSSGLCKRRKQVDAKTVYGVNRITLGYKTYNDWHEKSKYLYIRNHCIQLAVFHSRVYQSKSQKKYMLVANNNVTLRKYI